MSSRLQKMRNAATAHRNDKMMPAPGSARSSRNQKPSHVDADGDVDMDEDDPTTKSHSNKKKKAPTTTTKKSASSTRSSSSTATTEDDEGSDADPGDDADEHPGRASSNPEAGDDEENRSEIRPGKTVSNKKKKKASNDESEEKDEQPKAKKPRAPRELTTDDKAKVDALEKAAKTKRNLQYRLLYCVSNKEEAKEASSKTEEELRQQRIDNKRSKVELSRNNVVTNLNPLFQFLKEECHVGDFTEETKLHLGTLAIALLYQDIEPEKAMLMSQPKVEEKSRLTLSDKRLALKGATEEQEEESLRMGGIGNRFRAPAKKMKPNARAIQPLIVRERTKSAAAERKESINERIKSGADVSHEDILMEDEEEQQQDQSESGEEEEEDAEDSEEEDEDGEDEEDENEQVDGDDETTTTTEESPVELPPLEKQVSSTTAADEEEDDDATME
jgi:hypothetical protein